MNPLLAPRPRHSAPAGRSLKNSGALYHHAQRLRSGWRFTRAGLGGGIAAGIIFTLVLNQDWRTAQQRGPNCCPSCRATVIGDSQAMVNAGGWT